MLDFLLSFTNVDFELIRHLNTAELCYAQFSADLPTSGMTCYFTLSSTSSTGPSGAQFRDPASFKPFLRADFKGFRKSEWKKRNTRLLKSSRTIATIGVSACPCHQIRFSTATLSWTGCHKLWGFSCLEPWFLIAIVIFSTPSSPSASQVHCRWIYSISTRLV